MNMDTWKTSGNTSPPSHNVRTLCMRSSCLLWLLGSETVLCITPTAALATDPQCEQVCKRCLLSRQGLYTCISDKHTHTQRHKFICCIFMETFSLMLCTETFKVF